MKRPTRFVLFATLLLATVLARSADTNLLANGSFEQSRNRPEAPDDWSTAGNPAIQQQLLLDAGRNGGHCAKLVCSDFHGDGPDYHVMLCQVGKIGLRGGHWYRISFWAKAERLKAGEVEVGLSNTRYWENAGLSAAFTPDAQWQPFSFLFRAKQDLPPADSRLQFWFKSAGTLWMDDVVLTESTEGQQWFPQIATDGVKNSIPNSSFECGLANWGSFTWGLGGWAGNVYRLEGQLDTNAAHHGKYSLRISLSPTNLPVFYFDYYEPVRQPVRRVLAANQGWFRVKPGEALTLSAWLKADTDSVVAQLAANECDNHLFRKQVTVEKEWQRYEFTFTPTQPFLFIALGLDLEASRRDTATLWLDAVQLERGDHATEYEPRQSLEAFLETSAPGNISTNQLIPVLQAYNNSDHEQTLHGNLELTDFFDRTSSNLSAFDYSLQPHSGAAYFSYSFKNSLGFFRAKWTSGTTTQSIRCAFIKPAATDLADSPLGFNHAYPWDFLVQSAREAGVLWWRDWSAKFQTVEPQKGKFDFTIPDPQIQRVLALNSQVEVLLPFPSASWCTMANTHEVEKAARGDSYLLSRLPVSYAPKDLNDFATYAAAVARHYIAGLPSSAVHSASSHTPTYFQILNEPLYTDYALPRRFGYALADYLRLLETASRAIHAVSPDCRVVGGFSAGLDSGLTRDFITHGGLRFLDVFDLHMYDAARPAESFEESFAALENLMRTNGGPKPVWITEWGCYADDDPPVIPPTVGDETMNRCSWVSERAATEHIVKFTAIAFSHGVRKIFFHAGTCGTINSPDAGGVLFEYGGTPRKMYPGVAALSRFLGVPDDCLKRTHANGLHACLFRTQGHAVAIAWLGQNQIRHLQLRPEVTAFDVMGNAIPHPAVILEDSPVYLVADNSEAILASLPQLPK
jgi:hypothetical protein